MFITCEKCNGKGLDNDIPKKRCVDCGGKGKWLLPPLMGDTMSLDTPVVMGENGEIRNAVDLNEAVSSIGKVYLVAAVPNEEKFAEVLPVKKKPWYKFN